MIWSSRATRFRVQSPQRSGKRGECTQRPLPGRDAERRPSVSGRRASRAEPTTRRRTLALAFVEKNRIGSPLSSQTHGSSSYTTAHCTTPLLLTRPRGACCAPQPSSARCFAPTSTMVAPTARGPPGTGARPRLRTSARLAAHPRPIQGGKARSWD